MKIYIEDFVDDLNYRNVILYIGNVDHGKLFEKLRMNNTGHLYRFDSASMDNLLYIENCDLQTVDDDLKDYLEEGYVVYPLKYDRSEDKYYVETDLCIE